MNLTCDGYTYIMTNKWKTVLYTGVTSDLQKRVFQHKAHAFHNSFTARYQCEYLMWYEQFPSIEMAIACEKQIKAGSRAQKEALINSANPQWINLYETIC